MGAIFFNPGGPGGDGLALAPSMAVHWSRPDPANAAGEQLKKMSERYDMIGFSPRGVLDALPNASMIVVENEFRHGVFPYGEPCVDAQVAAYFLHATMPPRLSSCAGRPLPFDADNAGASQ